MDDNYKLLLQEAAVIAYLSSKVDKHRHSHLPDLSDSERKVVELYMADAAKSVLNGIMSVIDGQAEGCAGFKLVAVEPEKTEEEPQSLQNVALVTPHVFRDVSGSYIDLLGNKVMVCKADSVAAYNFLKKESDLISTSLLGYEKACRIALSNAGILDLRDAKKPKLLPWEKGSFVDHRRRRQDGTYSADVYASRLLWWIKYNDEILIQGTGNSLVENMAMADHYAIALYNLG